MRLHGPTSCCSGDKGAAECCRCRCRCHGRENRVCHSRYGTSDLYIISGHRVKEFSPPVPLNGLSWFPIFLKSQSNFSLGFNRLSDEVVVQARNALI